MTNELRSSGHTVGETNLHLQFTPAYRRDIFREPLVRELTIAYLAERAQQMQVQLAAIDCGPDHLHLFVKNWKNWAVKVLAGQLKTYSSRKMRKGHSFLFSNKLWGKKFWSAGYFHRTVGAVTAETVKRYIAEGQKKHWKQQKKEQKTLLNYSS
jgi:REP element-mobilizing transposase RayT